MDAQQVFTIGQQGLYVLLLVAAPILLTVLAVGVLVSVFQAATQINESTLSFIPKIVGVCLVLILAGPMLMEMLVDYTRALFTGLPSLIG